MRLYADLQIAAPRIILPVHSSQHQDGAFAEVIVVETDLSLLVSRREMVNVVVVELINFVNVPCDAPQGGTDVERLTRSLWEAKIKGVGARLARLVDLEFSVSTSEDEGGPRWRYDETGDAENAFIIKPFDVVAEASVDPGFSARQGAVGRVSEQTGGSKVLSVNQKADAEVKVRLRPGIQAALTPDKLRSIMVVRGHYSTHTV